MGIQSPTSGRGLQRLRSLLTEFEGAWATAGDSAAPLPSVPVAAAKPVVPGRMAICSPAGQVKPEEWIKEPKRSQFLDWQNKVVDQADELTLPKFCHMVDKSDEAEIREKLLESGMAVLVEEERIPRTAQNRLLLGGLFAVDHKEASDRLMFDRRPANEQERRFAWVALPMGAQLTRLVLEEHEDVRGSGDDLRTYFYRLKAPPGAEIRNCFGRRIMVPTSHDGAAAPALPIDSD